MEAMFPPALYRFVRGLVAKKGHVSDEEINALLNNGYSRGALFELIGQVGHTTLANLAHGIQRPKILPTGL
jgi:hypothetical protein